MPSTDRRDRRRLLEIVDVLQALARLEFMAKAPVGERGDVFDALAAGVNMLGEELASFRQEVDERAEALALANAELARRALYDTLTGIPNRALFSDRIEHALARMARADPRIAVLFLDLDDFKLVNDGFGHDTGDEALRAVARRLERAIRPGDTAARFGGDEFGILLEDADEATAVEVAARVLSVIRVPAPIDGENVSVTGSIGIAFPDPSLATAGDLLRAADIAMYSAKRQGRGQFSIYKPEMQGAVLLELELRHDLEAAIARSEIFLAFQPIVELQGGRISGVEALARWASPKRGLVAPTDFIPAAEQSGLIVPLGRSVLNAACRQLSEWRASLGEQAPDYIAINLSPRQLRDERLDTDLRDALRAADLEPHRLVVEVTESSAVDDAAVAKLVELKALGIQLAIDDFGTGYSSLSSFARLPFDIVKIDRAFVSGHASEGHTLVRLVINFARELGRDVVAEGVETAEQARRLLQLGCRHAQGFYYAAPMKADEMTMHLRQGSIATDDLEASATAPTTTRAARTASASARAEIDAVRPVARAEKVSGHSA